MIDIFGGENRRFSWSIFISRLSKNRQFNEKVQRQRVQPSILVKCMCKLRYMYACKKIYWKRQRQYIGIKHEVFIQNAAKLSYPGINNNFFKVFHPSGVVLFPSSKYNYNYKLQYFDFRCWWSPEWVVIFYSASVVNRSCRIDSRIVESVCSKLNRAFFQSRWLFFVSKTH
jgi:hypothetical protein